MRVLITRPHPDAELFAAQLADHGHVPLIEPLIDIHFAHDIELNLDGIQALVFTSANGARAAAMNTPRRDIRVFAVGPVTAAEAANLGFQDIVQSRGEGVADLADHLSTIARPGAGSLLHIAGSVTAGDLGARLSGLGFSVIRQQAYEARASTELSAATADALREGRVDIATFFSPRTASVFSTLVRKAGLAACCTKVTACALSTPVAKSLTELTFRKLLTAHTATSGAMLAMVDAESGTTGGR